MKPIVFLDRDGTLIEDRHFVSRVDDVVPLPGAPAAVRALNEAGVLAVVITNQSGIARGLITQGQYEGVKAALDAQLSEAGARLDATFYCPHHPDFTGACECRKPGTLLYRQALESMDVDRTRVAAIGDRWRDIAPMRELGGIGILVPSLRTPGDERARSAAEFMICDTLQHAVAQLLTTWKLAA